jgi:AcrR family transcriptional regulator
MTERPPRPPRHRADGGYARGEETRRRIIEVALRLFGERGYEGASTREIAAAAGVNAPALQYYFDNKEGVYRACAQYIADASEAHFAPVVERIQRTADDPGAKPAQLFEAFGQLLDAVADHHLLPDDAMHKRLFMAHEQVGEGPSLLFDILDKGLRPRMADVGMRLVGRYCGIPPDDPGLRMRVMMVFGQIMVFTTGQRSLVSKLGWDRIGPAQLALVKQAVREHARAMMDHWKRDTRAAK